MSDENNPPRHLRLPGSTPMEESRPYHSDPAIGDIAGRGDYRRLLILLKLKAMNHYVLRPF
jgi:hypothetical protein